MLIGRNKKIYFERYLTGFTVWPGFAVIVSEYIVMMDSFKTRIDFPQSLLYINYELLKIASAEIGQVFLCSTYHVWATTS